MTGIYSDVNKDYQVDSNPLVVQDVVAINKSIANILNTVPGERLFLPEFGSYITDFVFDPINSNTAHSLLVTAISAIERWEPRVRILSQLSTVIPFPDESRYEMTIVYEVILTQDTGTFNQNIQAQAV